MTITRADVADLRPGDVVEIIEVIDGDTYTHRGPVKPDGPRTNGLAFGDLWLRNQAGDPGSWIGTLTVISRAPRPLYVNHDRTEPMPGDVVRQENAPTHASGHTWHYLKREDRDGRWWRFDDTRVPFDEDAPLRLLVDGTTGEVVP